MDINCIYNATDVDYACNKFFDDVTSLIERHAPTKVCAKKN